MALLIYPDGKQEFLTLPGKAKDRQQLLTDKFAQDTAVPASNKIAEGSMAQRLQFQQIVIQRSGSGCQINKPGVRFCGVDDSYKGVMAFLRASELI